MALQLIVSFGFILVVNAPQNMIAYGTDTLCARDFVRIGFALTILALVLVLEPGAISWNCLGYV